MTPSVFYLAADTNVYLSRLDLLKRLRRQSRCSLGKPHLYIPRTVVQELRSQRRRRARDEDNPRQQRRAAWLRQHARRSLLFILCLRLRSPGNVKFETPREMQRAARRYNTLGQDGDSCILKSLLHLRDGCNRQRNRSVVLWTNDRRFRLRATLAGVRAMNHSSIVTSFS